MININTTKEEKMKICISIQIQIILIYLVKSCIMHNTNTIFSITSWSDTIIELLGQR